jgi:hypothetical protein
MSRQERPSAARSTDPDEQYDEPPLSASAAELIEAALLERQRLATLASTSGAQAEIKPDPALDATPGFTASVAPTLSAGRLVRYLAGERSPELGTTVEQAILDDPAWRARLRFTRNLLRSLTSHPHARMEEAVCQWADAEELFAAEVIAAWRELLAERIATTAQSRHTWVAEGWERVRAEAAAGKKAAVTAWAAFAAYAEQWRGALDLHALTPALQRSSDTGMSEPFDSDSEKTDFYAGIAITDVQCRIEDDGTLVVTAIVAPTHEPDAPQGHRTSLLLSLRRDEDIWPLAVGRRLEDRVEWRLPAFGAALDLSAGPLPTQFFKFDPADAAELDAADSQLILAPVLDAEGHPMPNALAYIELASPPQWQDGILSLRVGIPYFIRLAYPAHLLELSLYVSEQLRQLLDTWPIQAWTDEPMTLTIEFPEAPDVTLSPAPIILARLLGT